MNGEMNVFNSLNLDLSRVTYHIKPRRSGTCVAGRLIPALAYEVMPGSTVSIDLASLFKMSTPVYPTMDNLFADVFFFFVPNKLVLGRRYGTPNLNDSNQDWKAIIGAQSNLVNMPLPASGLSLPTMQFALRNPYLLCDYFNIGGTWSGQAFKANCLPFLSYFAIWNENFRDENTMDPVTWSFSSGNDVYVNGFVPLWINNLEDVGSLIPSGSNYGVVNALRVNSASPVSGVSADYLMPFCTCRFHSYLGSALPWPQRNSAGVELPLGNSAPVITGPSMMKADGSSDYLKTTGLRFLGVNGTTFSTLPAQSLIGNFGSTYKAGATGTQDLTGNTSTIVPDNLYADLSEATAANVNALRAAIQQQRWYEKLARSGNRYDELKYGLFGVRGLDAVLDKPLYLGGKRIPLNIEMVASTQGGTSASSGQGAGSLGALGAFSHTNDNDHYFSHSFDDWGTLMMVFTIRHHTTVDGFTKKMWLRRTREDFYFPTFAHLGEMSISGTEISGDPTASNVYGYQQAWEDSRFEPDLVTGLLKVGRSLDYMTYVESFSSMTTIAGYLNASKQMVSIDNTLAVKSFASGFQFVYQFDFDIKARLPLPYDSVPGLMDHF